MSVVAERPHSVDYVHQNGIKARIDFTWGAPDDPVPKGICVTVNFANEDIRLIRERTVYISFEEAMRQGIRLAEDVIDMLLEPLD